MRKNLLALLLLASLAFPFSAAAEGFDIRKVRWGMARAEVVASEKGTNSKRQRDAAGMIIFDAMLFESSGKIAYAFNKETNLLESVTYILFQKDSASASAFFNALDESLKKTFKPVEDKRIAPADVEFLRVYQNSRTRVTLANIYKKEKALSLQFAQIK